MQEQTVIRFPEQTLQAVKEMRGERNQMLNNALNAELEKIRNLLVSYYFSSRQRVYNLAIDPASLSIDPTGTGSFVVHYMLGMFNACADLDYNMQEKMKIGVQADLETGEVILTGEYFPEREPDGY